MILSTTKIKRLRETGNWMFRTDDNGVSYDGFKWNPIGEWTTAPDWNPSPVIGGGLHGQGPAPGEYGCATVGGTRLVLAETKGPRISIDGDKIKVQHACILAVNEEALCCLDELCPDGWPGSMDLSEFLGSTATLTHVGGWLRCKGYSNYLSLKHVGGNLFAYGCKGNFPVLEYVGRDLYCDCGIEFNSLQYVGGKLVYKVCDENFPVLTTVGGSIYYDRTNNNFPELTTVKGAIYYEQASSEFPGLRNIKDSGFRRLTGKLPKRFTVGFYDIRGKQP